MPTVTGDNALEWKMKEMARRAGKKYEPEVKNPFDGMTSTEVRNIIPKISSKTSYSNL